MLQDHYAYRVLSVSTKVLYKHIFYGFIDFDKVFDSVDYWLFFCKQLESSSSATCSLSVDLLSLV